MTKEANLGAQLGVQFCPTFDAWRDKNGRSIPCDRCGHRRGCHVIQDAYDRETGASCTDCRRELQEQWLQDD